MMNQGHDVIKSGVLGSGSKKSAHEVSREIIGAAMKVHSELGPGLLERAYEACLAHELRKAGFKVERQVLLPLIYDGVQIDEAYRLDLLIDDLVIVELKTVEIISPVHEAQIIAYLKLSGKSLGLILNFKVSHLREGIKRFVNGKGWK